jgi:hypothetical protein
MPFKFDGVSETISCQAIFVVLTAAFLKLQIFRILRTNQILCFLDRKKVKKRKVKKVKFFLFKP